LPHFPGRGCKVRDDPWLAAPPSRSPIRRVDHRLLAEGEDTPLGGDRPHPATEEPVAPTVVPSKRATRFLIPAAAGLGLALLLFLLYRDVGAYFVGRWLRSKEYQHCFLVLPLVGWLIWRKRQELADSAGAPSWAGLAALVGAALVYLVALRAGARVIVGFSLPLLLLALGWAWLGWPTIKPVAAPILLTAFLIPVPRHMIGIAAMPMQVVSAHATAVLSGLMGMPATANGVTVTTRPVQFLVAEECSGFNSLLALLLIGCTAVHLLRMRPVRKLVLLALIPPIVLLANVIRLLTVVLTAQFLGAELALDALVHGFTDVILYLAALACVILLADLLRPRSGAGQAPSGAHG